MCIEIEVRTINKLNPKENYSCVENVCFNEFFKQIFWSIITRESIVQLILDGSTCFRFAMIHLSSQHKRTHLKSIKWVFKILFKRMSIIAFHCWLYDSSNIHLNQYFLFIFQSHAYIDFMGRWSERFKKNKWC